MIRSNRAHTTLGATAMALALCLVSCGAPPDASTWEVVPAELLEQMAWPTFEPVAVWPAPGSLTGLEALPEAERPAERDVELLRQNVELVLGNAVQGAPTVDDRGRLFLRLEVGGDPGLASAQMRGDPEMPSSGLALVFRTEQPPPADVAALREQLGRYLIAELVEELQTGEMPLQAHPRYPFAANGHLSPSGPSQMGLYFQWVHAYGRDGYVLIVFY